MGIIKKFLNKFKKKKSISISERNREIEELQTLHPLIDDSKEREFDPSIDITPLIRRARPDTQEEIDNKVASAMFEEFYAKRFSGSINLLGDSIMFNVIIKRVEPGSRHFAQRTFQGRVKRGNPEGANYIHEFAIDRPEGLQFYSVQPEGAQDNEIERIYRDVGRMKTKGLQQVVFKKYFRGNIDGKEFAKFMLNHIKIKECKIEEKLK